MSEGMTASGQRFSTLRTTSHANADVSNWCAPGDTTMASVGLAFAPLVARDEATSRSVKLAALHHREVQRPHQDLRQDAIRLVRVTRRVMEELGMLLQAENEPRVQCNGIGAFTFAHRLSRRALSYLLECSALGEISRCSKIFVSRSTCRSDWARCVSNACRCSWFVAAFCILGSALMSWLSALYKSRSLLMYSAFDQSNTMSYSAVGGLSDAFDRRECVGGQFMCRLPCPPHRAHL